MTYIEVDVFAESVEHAIDKIMAVFSEERLTEFLEGPLDKAHQARVSQRFDAEGDASSGRWSELKPATQEIRESMGFPPDHPINERTGDLRAWMLEAGFIEPGPDGIGISWPGPGTGGAELETKFEHAQRGGVSDWGNSFPPRPVLAFGPDEVAMTAREFVVWFVEQMR